MSMLIEDCPRCGASKVTFDVTQVNERDTAYDWQRRYEAFCICRGCNGATVFRLTQADIRSQRLLSDTKVMALANLNQVFRVEGYLSLKDKAAQKAPDHLPAQIDAV